MHESEFKSLNFGLIGKESSLKGDLTFKGDTIIDGEVDGIINVLNGHKLICERHSRIEGQIYAHDIEIFGHFKGKISAQGTLTIHSSAFVEGNIQSNSLQVFPGAMLNIEGDIEA